MSYDERKVAKVVITFDDGSVTQTSRFNMSAEEHVSQLLWQLEYATKEIERLNELFNVDEIDRLKVLLAKNNREHEELKKEYEFQESRCKALADAIMDTRMAMQAKLDEALKELAYIKGNQP